MNRRRPLGAFFGLISGLAAFVLGLGPAAAFETVAGHALMVDYDTGMALFEKDADAVMYPASMTKIMTAYLTFERLAEGSIELDTMFQVSEKAWRKGGSKMFVEVGDRVSVGDLLRGVIVQSGNDASIVLAEGIAGSEEAFGGMMTDKAIELGMGNSLFLNATGWPDDNHVTTARDLATLAAATIRDFPQYYPLFGETSFTYADIEQSNRNPVLFADIGADGLKTGHTEASGYGLTTSAVRDGRRLVLVINGLDSERARGLEAKRMLGWGFANFNNYQLLGAGEIVDEAQTWMGQDPSVPVALAEDLTVTMSRAARADMIVTMRYDGPIAAPVAAGDVIATLIIEAADMVPIERDLIAMRPVARLGFFARQIQRLREFVYGSLRSGGMG